MTTASLLSAQATKPTQVLEQTVLGSRRFSNVLASAIISAGGIGFFLSSASSYLGKDLLPMGHPSALVWIPQGLVMGLYGSAAILLATYLWTVISIDLGSGINRFDNGIKKAIITRRGFRRIVSIEIPLEEILAINMEVRDGLNPRRRLTLSLKNRRNIPLTRIGEPIPLAQLEQEGAKLARFLGVPLEGL
uniref:Photosystem I assembly protein Ycf4 n=1 Tax=Paulinella chromatophora TaxID=39717 RepID=B1X3H3_PAUCH|nr:photosystem I assembly protein Ycf4 [Paulinella chromatophora]ACB42492.1 photosystem I assembly protein Ycf4 [Paulinella chromatophora]